MPQIRVDTRIDVASLVPHSHTSISFSTRPTTPPVPLPLVSSTEPLPSATSSIVRVLPSPRHVPASEAFAAVDDDVPMGVTEVRDEHHAPSIPPMTADAPPIEASQLSHASADDNPFLVTQSVSSSRAEQPASPVSPLAAAAPSAEDSTASPFPSPADSEATLVSIEIPLKGLKLVEAGDHPKEESMCTRSIRHSRHKSPHTPYNARRRRTDRRRSEDKVKASVPSLFIGLDDGDELPDYEEVEPELAALFAPVAALVASLVDDEDDDELSTGTQKFAEDAAQPKLPAASFEDQAVSFLDDLASFLHSVPPVVVAA